jgi:cytidylate kinase
MTAPAIIVAVDGAAGSGKSTLARGLARALGVAYINTGSMYRALAAASIRAEVDADDAEALVDLARGLRFTLGAEEPAELEVEGYRTAELTTREVESRVSVVSRHPAVRTMMRNLQRTLGARGAVMEGRDIATVVFPDAPLKVYLRASERERSDRRARERGSADSATVRDAIRERDARDARTNRLEPAPGAVVIDTSELSIDATLGAALEHARRIWPEVTP